MVFWMLVRINFKFYLHVTAFVASFRSAYSNRYKLTGIDDVNWAQTRMYAYLVTSSTESSKNPVVIGIPLMIMLAIIVLLNMCAKAMFHRDLNNILVMIAHTIPSTTTVR